MKDKYRLSDKFIVISYLLCPDDADTDFAEFQKAKEVRDKLLHGQDISEETLPVITVQNITRKCFRLHLDR